MIQKEDWPVKTPVEHAEYYQHVARTEWFKDHIVSVRTYNGGPDVSKIVVVDFRRPNTCTYAVRYVFDGNKVYVSGDLGDAVFNCTWRVSPVDKTWNSLWYIFEKLSASESGREMDFNSDVCVETVRQTLLESGENGDLVYPEDWGNDEISAYTALISGAQEAAGADHWTQTIREVDDEYGLDRLDSDYWEWLYGAGNVMPPRIVGIITGLQIVSERLRKIGWREET